MGELGGLLQGPTVLPRGRGVDEPEGDLRAVSGIDVATGCGGVPRAHVSQTFAAKDRPAAPHLAVSDFVGKVR